LNIGRRIDRPFEIRSGAMFRNLLLAALVAVSFAGSILASATPASALYYRFDTVSVSTFASDDDDDDDDYSWLF
jgi:hypothetical protein